MPFGSTVTKAFSPTLCLPQPNEWHSLRVTYDGARVMATLNDVTKSAPLQGESNKLGSVLSGMVRC